MKFGIIKIKNRVSNSLRDFRIIIASNSDQYGINMGIWNRNKLLIEIFRDDKNHKHSISLYKKDLPLKLVEESIEFFREKVRYTFTNQ